VRSFDGDERFNSLFQAQSYDHALLVGASAFPLRDGPRAIGCTEVHVFSVLPYFPVFFALLVRTSAFPLRDGPRTIGCTEVHVFSVVPYFPVFKYIVRLTWQKSIQLNEGFGHSFPPPSPL